MGSMKTPRSALVGTQLQAEDPLQVPHEDAEIRGFPPQFLTKTTRGGHHCHLVTLGIPPFHKLCRALRLTLRKG